MDNVRNKEGEVNQSFVQLSCSQPLRLIGAPHQDR